jgi:hypothetical protein
VIALLKAGLEDGVTTEGIADALHRHADETVSEDLDELARVLEEYLRNVPDAIGSALAMSRDPHCGRAVAFGTGTILTYIFDEEDLLPEASFGTLGLLDDAYLVHSFVDSLRRMYPFAAPSLTYAAPDAKTSEVVATILPEGVAESLRRTCESTIQVAQALFPSGQGAGAADAAFEPRLRVTEAAAASAAAASPS